MVNENELGIKWDTILGPHDILLFDLDGTLIDTNLANYYSYQVSIKRILDDNLSRPYDPNDRFTRDTLRKLYPSLSDVTFNKIIKEKNKRYEDFLPATRMMPLIVEILKKYSLSHSTVLATNCREGRAIATLKFHGLLNHFRQKYFYEQIGTEGMNKFVFVISTLRIQPENIIVFEDDLDEIKLAFTAGISKQKIFRPI
jgi:beta-phosphoglucomutase